MKNKLGPLFIKAKLVAQHTSQHWYVSIIFNWWHGAFNRKQSVWIWKIHLGLTYRKMCIPWGPICRLVYCKIVHFPATPGIKLLHCKNNFFLWIRILIFIKIWLSPPIYRVTCCAIHITWELFIRTLLFFPWFFNKKILVNQK